MIYTSILLKNFRSYKNSSIELEPGVNIVVGPNASGKTNLLESILIASRGTSFRGSDITPIRHGKEAAKITATTSRDQERSVVYRLQPETNRLSKEIKINGVINRRLVIEKIVPTVLFEPEHLRMVHGSPERRRDYLDGILIATQVGYKTTLNKYRKALAQRNRLLKSDRTLNADDVFVWDVQLSEYGAKIHTARRALSVRINQEANELYSSISGSKQELSVTYNGDEVSDYASNLLKHLQTGLSDDLLRGFTSKGPHREDLHFNLNGSPASQTASRGESRTIVLVCKLVEIKLVEEVLDKKPIVLLDDVFSELDGARRIALADYLRDTQTIITTTDADAIIKSFLDGYNVIATD